MTLGIYIHIPFCLSKCPYCDFNSIVIDSELAEYYVNSLVKEILSFSENQTENLVAETIYFGGGTPSILKVSQLGSIMKAVFNSFDVKPVAEISLEVNPGTLTEEKAKDLKKLGFNRASLGVQSFKDEELKILGRAHDSKQAIKSYQLLRKYFDNLSLDSIFGIPGQNLNSWRENLKMASKLKPEHLSVYSLTIEEGTPYHHLWKQEKLSLPDDEEVRKMYLLSINLLQKQEYRQYELSNFARKGFECQHNLRYWQGKEYLGFGAGAHSYYQGVRWGNVKNVKKYIEGCKNGFSIFDFREKLTSSQKITEFILLGLRVAKGIDLRRLKENMNFDIEEEKREEIAKLIEGRFLKKGKDNLRLTKKGILVANSIVQQLIP
ncbi:MAG TPA: radical SAM family heme chaperone HemW [Terriglobales bacterium]|nr:radical SAM family heme chaperone HemW [Terriglobales bacterium]